MKNKHVYSYVQKIAKRYGFKEYNSRMFHLDDRYELTISGGNTISDTYLVFEFEDMSKRPGRQQWGGTITKMTLDTCGINNNIMFSTLDTWIRTIFELDEMQPYMRSAKIKKLKKTNERKLTPIRCK